jgi:acyl-CoA synthetase (NDP forming)
MGGPFTLSISAKIEESNVPVYHTVNTWVTAAATLAKWARVRQKAR